MGSHSPEKLWIDLIFPQRKEPVFLIGKLHHEIFKAFGMIPTIFVSAFKNSTAHAYLCKFGINSRMDWICWCTLEFFTLSVCPFFPQLERVPIFSPSQKTNFLIRQRSYTWSLGPITVKKLGFIEQLHGCAGHRRSAI